MRPKKTDRYASFLSAVASGAIGQVRVYEETFSFVYLAGEVGPLDQIWRTDCDCNRWLSEQGWWTRSIWNASALRNHHARVCCERDRVARTCAVCEKPFLEESRGLVLSCGVLAAAGVGECDSDALRHLNQEQCAHLECLSLSETVGGPRGRLLRNSLWQWIRQTQTYRTWSATGHSTNRNEP